MGALGSLHGAGSCKASSHRCQLLLTHGRPRRSPTGSTARADSGEVPASGCQGTGSARSALLAIANGPSSAPVSVCQSWGGRALTKHAQRSAGQHANTGLSWPASAQVQREKPDSSSRYTHRPFLTSSGGKGGAQTAPFAGQPQFPPQNQFKSLLP